MLPIIIYGNPILRKKSIEIKKGEDLNLLISQMYHTMRTSNGCGLAAPQIGKNIMLFITEYGDKNENLISKTYINPQWKILEGAKYEYSKEGCLSIPRLNVNVLRPNKIFVSYLNEKWEKVEEELVNFAARVFLHEHDHLMGKLITDYVPNDKKKDLEKFLKEIKMMKNKLK